MLCGPARPWLYWLVVMLVMLVMLVVLLVLMVAGLRVSALDGSATPGVNWLAGSDDVGGVAGEYLGVNECTLWSSHIWLVLVGGDVDSGDVDGSDVVNGVAGVAVSE